MTKILKAAALAAAIALPQAASAQALPAPSIAVVDIQRASSECNACKTAFTNLQAQFNGLQTFAKAQDTQIGNEQKTIQAQVDALAGKAPDAALNARMEAWGKKREDAQRTVSQREAQFVRNRDYVNQQISAKLDPALSAVMSKRGANVLLDSSQVLRAGSAIDITTEVIAALNTSLTSIATAAPAAAAAPARPAPAATAPKTTPRR